MPLLLDDIDVSTAQSSHKAIDPKFFSSKLTGNGKARYGLLNSQLLPVASTSNTAYLADAGGHIETKAISTQNGITVTTIPIAPMTRRALTQAGSFTLAAPHAQERCVIDTDSNYWDISFALTPQAAKLYEDAATGAKRMPREFLVQYRMELFFFKRGATEPERVMIASNTSTVGRDALVFTAWDISPLENAGGFIDDRLHAAGLSRKNPDALETWLTEEYSVCDAITAQAEIWDSEAMADQVCAYIDGLPASQTDEQLNALAVQLRYLENYNVPLEVYRSIHKKIETAFNDGIASKLSKQNLNLLMSHTLSHLEAMKGHLTTPVRPAAAPVLPAHLSAQQTNAVITHEPLVMTQAGAGTGKSTVILQRIKYLEACGVPASDITVLSFTNAASDNITAKNPDVGSMTIARMINDIYTLNHPSHELSSIDTIINSIEIFYPTSNFAAQFRMRLLEVDQNKTGAFTALNTFIENKFDQVMDVLDRIKQTSLELEIIICYQRIDAMIEPPKVQCRYLVIDEVQDNSIFEFIYVLKYISKHAQSLFIVGDASQTLYEFRSANPRALNTLEGSGVFTTFRLTTNYRSNQEILDFANVVLGDLETNQIANIQLKANSLARPTADTFREKVILDYRAVPKLTTFVSDDLAGIVRATIAPNYVDTCLARGEQVAFLAYSRREVTTIEKVLQEKYPQRHVASLVSDRVFATDIFSKYIKFFWNDVLQVPPHNAAFVVTQGIRDNLGKLTNNAGSPNVEKAVLRMVSNWWLENSATINGWVQLTLLSSLPHAEFFDRLRDNLLSYEIRHNAVRQSLTNQKNRERKANNAQAKADLVVSTIHGAKGMEFDNVVVLHRENTAMTQDVKRMYYVAFTRAMHSEYVLSYGTVKNPPIESDYEQILSVLAERDKQTAARATGSGPDPLDDADDADQTDGTPLTQAS
ncbi:UvrD-helicase domain-containing protein [Actinomadura syzygii]|uniref:ATP-dependent helicase n=1 Tax=Actinomadura syzygii TaxID=1427538 RepID=A0A5D0TRU1_9ACTN|nr:ATP-dependent helicase [Actinomadura syzygii]TYC08557.1 ATP-dependent helicase [Actinomadura syzygii]